MYKKLNQIYRLIKIAPHIFKAVDRHLTGGLFVWRDSPTWVVKVVSTAPEKDDAVYNGLIAAAKAEYALRLQQQLPAQ